MEKIKRNGYKVIILAIVAIVLIIVAAFAIKKMIPSKQVMDLTEYYQIDSDKILVILQNEISEEQGLFLDGIVYVSYDTVSEFFNHRFYWDANENVLIYTTQSEVIKTEIGSNDYYVNKSKTTVPYQIVKTIGNKVYLALDYVKLFSNVEYQIYETPNRVVVQYDWGQDYLYSKVKKNTQLRYEASIKSDILVQLKEDDVVTYVDTEADKSIKKIAYCHDVVTYVDTEVVEDSKFKKVMTEDGVIGYVKSKCLTAGEYETLKNDYVEQEYSHITKDYTISLGWHQVTNQDANNNLLTVLDQSKGINTISPTWFSVASNEGTITSLASETYVERAHNAGVEVWGLCDDFNTEIDMLQILSYTSRREKLENELISTAIKYDLDGINIDFENITAASAEHYIEFLRELSIKCRNNGIVLSVDNYVPAPYNSFYNLKEQGQIVDYVIIMAYDEHHGNSEESGSVSSMTFFQDAIDNTFKDVDKERVIMALPFYTRLWTEAEDGTLSSAAYSMSKINSIIEANQAEKVWDEETQQYYAEFTTEDGLNKVWLEDDKSIELRMKAASDANVAGMAYWKLGMEKSSIWKVIQKFIN